MICVDEYLFSEFADLLKVINDENGVLDKEDVNIEEDDDDNDSNVVVPVKHSVYYYVH